MSRRIRNVVMGTVLPGHCIVCDAPKKGRARVVEFTRRLNYDTWIICLPCARRIGKAAEVKA